MNTISLHYIPLDVDLFFFSWFLFRHLANQVVVVVFCMFFLFLFFSWKGQTLNWNSNAWLIKFSGKFKKNMRCFFFFIFITRMWSMAFQQQQKKNWLKCVYFTLYVPYNEKEQEIFLVMKVCLLYHWQQIIRTWW